MCLAYCYKRGILFDTDTDEVCVICPHNFPEGKDCRQCKNQEGAMCSLARAQLPARGWCCHFSSSAQWQAEAWQNFVQGNLKGYLRQQPLERVLQMYGAEYEDADGGAYRVKMDSLSTPMVYGEPTAHWADELAEVEATPDLEWLDVDGVFVFEL